MMLKNQSIKLPLKSITKHAQRFNKARSAKNKLKKKFNKEAKAEIYGYYQYSLQKRLNREIINHYRNKREVAIKNELKKLRLAKLANNNISEKDMVNIKQLVALTVKTLRQIAKLRNISTNLLKNDTIYALIRSDPIINEQKYIFDSNNEIRDKINKIRMQLFDVSPYLNKKDRNDIRKRLYSIGKIQKVDRKSKNKLIKELNSMSRNLKSMQKRMISDYRDEIYANIDDIVYIFGNIDSYCAPILTSSLFDKGYQRYHFRGDKMRNMLVKSYLANILPYLRVLIDENKAYEQKIQIDIGFNMVHISNNRRIKDFCRSDNVICKPSSNTNEILGQLLASLYERFQDDLQLSRESSNFACVRTTSNSRHTILSDSFEIKRENTSRGRKISFEIWRCSKYGKSVVRVC